MAPPHSKCMPAYYISLTREKMGVLALIDLVIPGLVLHHVAKCLIKAYTKACKIRDLPYLIAQIQCFCATKQGKSLTLSLNT